MFLDFQSHTLRNVSYWRNQRRLKIWRLTDGGLPDLAKTKMSYILSGNPKWMSIYILVKPKLGVYLCFCDFLWDHKNPCLGFFSERDVTEVAYAFSGLMVIRGIFYHESCWAYTEAKWILEVMTPVQKSWDNLLKTSVHYYFLSLIGSPSHFPFPTMHCSLPH